VTVPFELPVTIAITGRFDDQTLAVLDKQIARFEEQNPDIRVAVLSAPRKEARRHQDYVDRLSARDTSRDIYVLEAIELAELDANGWLIPLDDYVGKYEIELGDFWPATLQANTVNGHLAALPWLADGGLLYYRQDLLEQYGKQVPATWNDLRQVALEIKAEESLPSGFVWQGAPYESLTCNALEFIWAHGGKVLDEQGQAVFDSPETRAALQEMLDFVTQGASPPEVATYNETSTLSAFGSGEAAFMRNWTYAWDRLNQTDSPVSGRVGLAPLPVSCLGGLSLALSSHSLHPEESARFMAFLAGYDQQLQIAREGIQPPALESVYHDAELLAEAPIVRALQAALSVARPRPQSPAYLEISGAIYTDVNKMLLGEQDVAQTVDHIQEQIEAALH
jgi:multiple sugar transport system substrate-binding protein